MLATLDMLQAQLAASRAETEAATAHAILMARENVKLNNLLNAKTGKKKEGGRAHFQGAARCLTAGEGLEQKRREAEEIQQQKEVAEAKRVERKANQERRRQEKVEHTKQVQERRALRELNRLVNEDARKKRQQAGGRGRGRGGGRGRGRGGAGVRPSAHQKENARTDYDDESSSDGAESSSDASSDGEFDGEAVLEVPQGVRRSSRARPDRPWATRLAAIDESP
jgi:hypothetical protein